MAVRCCRCHRVLTDPVSVAAGIGPVCRGFYAEEEQGDMFMGFEADFTWHWNGSVLCIVDLDAGSKSVTNDAENVLAKIGIDQCLKASAIIYRDSTGRWDGLQVNNRGEFSGFYGIGAICESQAIDWLAKELVPGRPAH